MDNNYFEKAISFESLYNGLKSACKNVRWKDSVIRYEAYGLRNTYKLRQSLLHGQYQISDYQKFKVHEPKERIIFAPRLVDRQLQHALCDNGLYDDVSEHFIRDSMACQKGRGTDDALNRFKVHLQRYYRHFGADGWVLKCDIHHFFQETPHETAKASANKYIKNKNAAEMICMIIDSFEGDIGLGLGSQISQIIELSVLNELDHYIKEKLKIKYYIRYMDDFILIHQDKEYLKCCLNKIAEKIKSLGLSLNKKTTLQPLKHGIVFLKWHFYLLSTGKIIMKISKTKITKQKRRLKKLINADSVKAATNSLLSFIGNAQRGNTYKIQRHMKQFYYILTGSELNDRKIQKTKTRRSSKCRHHTIP